MNCLSYTRKDKFLVSRIIYARACLKIHCFNITAPFCVPIRHAIIHAIWTGGLCPNKVWTLFQIHSMQSALAKAGCSEEELNSEQPLANCDIHPVTSKFQTHSRNLPYKIVVQSVFLQVNIHVQIVQLFLHNGTVTCSYKKIKKVVDTCRMLC